MPRNISEIDFTIFDLETTGLEPGDGDRVVEIAAVRLRDKRKLGEFHSLVNPGERSISPAAYEVNQISQEILKNAPPIDEVLPEFLEFISGSCLAAYNAPFDLAFLSSELGLINSKLPEGLQIADILIMTKRILPGFERYALAFVAKTLGIESIQQHRALSDVYLTVEVFIRLIPILTKKGIVDFDQFASLFGLSSKLLDDINNAKIARIQQALDLGVTLKIRYLTRNNAVFTEREIIPKEITRGKNQMYLVGFCKLRDEERTFRIQNILHLEMGRPVHQEGHPPDWQKGCPSIGKKDVPNKDRFAV